MELKLLKPSFSAASSTLLIVPYGIETKFKLDSLGKLMILLIVPYGIETSTILSQISLIDILLIVPYGIET